MKIFKNYFRILISIPVWLIIISFNSALFAQEYSIDVNAGAFDRSHTVVSFYLPHSVEKGEYLMFGTDGEEVTLQVDNNNKAWFILDELNAGESRSFQFSTSNPVTEESHTGMNYLLDDNTIRIQAGDNHVLSYFYRENEPPAELDDRYKRGGYIHPVYSPSGVLLTNHLNVAVHPHHSGIWSAWTNTEFEGRNPDFWNIHSNTGRVDVDSDSFESWHGSVFSGFSSKHHFIDISAPNSPEIAVNEKWEVRVFQSGDDYHQFDLVSTQTVNTGKPLLLPEYHYGGVGFRGHVDWDDPENCTFLTDEGLSRDGHGTRTRWTHIGGNIDGELAGIAILGHPSNFRHPQTVRIHPEEPFFNYAPQQLGEMSIEPGSPYVARYRYITYDGEPDSEKLDRLWNDFAYPPGVTVKVLD